MIRTVETSRQQETRRENDTTKQQHAALHDRWNHSNITHNKQSTTLPTHRWTLGLPFFVKYEI
jgi:hypothetical protein